MPKGWSLSCQKGLTLILNGQKDCDRVLLEINIDAMRKIFEFSVLSTVKPYNFINITIIIHNSQRPLTSQRSVVALLYE